MSNKKATRAIVVVSPHVMSSSIASPSADGLTARKQIDAKEDKKSEMKAIEFAHCFPIHTNQISSILSKENTEGLSFRGFGNLASK